VGVEVVWTIRPRVLFSRDGYNLDTKKWGIRFRAYDDCGAFLGEGIVTSISDVGWVRNELGAYEMRVYRRDHKGRRLW
jgi:hypothetical protein